MARDDASELPRVDDPVAFGREEKVTVSYPTDVKWEVQE